MNELVQKRFILLQMKVIDRRTVQDILEMAAKQTFQRKRRKECAVYTNMSE
jgi:hypothetical protein